jgi:hypothetical protein
MSNNDGEKTNFSSNRGNLIESILRIKKIDIKGVFWTKEELEKIKGFWFSFIVNHVNIKDQYISKDKFYGLLTSNKINNEKEVFSFILSVEMSDIFKDAEAIRQSYRKSLKQQLEAKGG